MTLSLLHAYVNPVVDAGNPNETGPDEWNAEHVLTQAADRLLGRLSTSGATQELTAAQVNTFLGTTGSAAHPGTSTDNAIARYDGLVGALQNSSTTISDVGTLGINPTAGLTGSAVNQGILVSQTATGSPTGVAALNQINITSDDMNVSGADAVTGFGLYIAHFTGGANAKGSRSSIFVHQIVGADAAVSASNRDYVGISSLVNSNAAMPVTATNAALFGFAAAVQADTGSTGLNGLVGAEIDLGPNVTGIPYVVGWNLVYQGSQAASTRSVAYQLSSTTTVGWKYGFALTNHNGQNALASTGTVMAALEAQTVAEGIDFSNLTITGDFLKGPSGNFMVSGAGVVKVNANAAALPTPPSTTLVHIGGADTVNTLLTFDGFAGNAGLVLRRANNTNASPQALASGDIMGQIIMRGHDGSTYPNANPIRLVAATSQTWTVGANGAEFRVYTTPNGSTTSAIRAVFGSDGGLTIGNGFVANAAGITVLAGSVLSLHATAGIGYGTGAGGAVTQGTSRTTGVTLDKITGAITLFSAAGSATPASFTVTNSAVAASDVVKVVQKSGTDLYEIFVTNVAAGSFKITFFTTGGTTTEQPVFNFVVLKGVAA